jgi:hypothetical protein
MARFIGRVQGSRGEVSRLGGTESGIQASAQGWKVGVRVCGGDQDGRDIFNIYATGGSNARSPEILVAVISLDESGAVVVETPQQSEARRSAVRRAANLSALATRP